MALFDFHTNLVHYWYNDVNQFYGGVIAALASALFKFDLDIWRNARSVSPTIPSTYVPIPRTALVQIALATTLRTA